MDDSCFDLRSWWDGLGDDAVTSIALQRFARRLRSGSLPAEDHVHAITTKLCLLLYSKFEETRKMCLTCCTLLHVSRVGGGVFSANMESLLAKFSDDCSPAVAERALLLLVELMVGHQFFGSEILYQQIRQKTSSHSPRVRVAALVAICALLENSSKSASGSLASVRDSAFALCCELSFDPDLRVQLAACEMLGTFTGIPESLLLQSLSKSAISQARGNRKRKLQPKNFSKASSVHAKIQAARGDIEIDLATEGLLEAFHYGALTEALENEHESVRLATVKAIGHLSLTSTEAVCARSLPFLYEMFHDEMVKVRISAVQTVSHLLQHWTTTISDVEVANSVLSVLLDRVPLVRWHAYRMLRFTHYATRELFERAQSELMLAFQRHPEDFRAILCCLRHLGHRHATFVREALRDMFHLDPRFLTTEMDVEFVGHQANCVLAFGAAETDPSMYSMLPKYLLEHRRYLEDRYPGAFAKAESTLQPTHESRIEYEYFQRAVQDVYSLKNVRVLSLVLSDFRCEFMELSVCDREEESINLALQCCLANLRLCLVAASESVGAYLPASTLLVNACICLTSAPLMTVVGSLAIEEVWQCLIVASFLLIYFGNAQFSAVVLELGQFLNENSWTTALETVALPFLSKEEPPSLADLLHVLAGLYKELLRMDLRGCKERLLPLSMQVSNPRSLAQDLLLLRTGGKRVSSVKHKPPQQTNFALSSSLRLCESLLPKLQPAAQDSPVSDTNSDRTDEDDLDECKKFALTFPMVDTGQTLTFKGFFPIKLPFEAEIFNISKSRVNRDSVLSRFAIRFGKPNGAYTFTPSIPKSRFSCDSGEEVKLLTKLEVWEPPSSGPFNLELCLCQHVPLPQFAATQLLPLAKKSNFLHANFFYRSFAPRLDGGESVFGVYVPLNPSFQLQILEHLELLVAHLVGFSAESTRSPLWCAEKEGSAVNLSILPQL